MSGLLTFFGFAALILLPVVVFGCVMSYVFPSKPHEMTQLEANRIVARNNGWVLHENYYKEGREVYVNPEYKNVSTYAIKSSFWSSNGKSCYQRPLKK